MDKTTKRHLAQINVGRIIGTSIDDPVMEKFVAQLDEVNTIADGSKGFVWRLKDGNNNAVSLNPFGDEKILINMSVWETIEDLEAYVYSGRHLEVLRSRRDWFVKFGQVFMALWYIQAGHIPTVEEARERLDFLQNNGPTPYAFDFKTRF
ncbi:MAG TPA: DUF3291 domain-containing protein [Puia sp.]|nr:DUF3291 domain-containing protein [Puia sp.]